MPRLPYAAVQLIKQVGEERENVEVESGEPDGLDVIRQVSFDKATSKWLWDRIGSNLDPRIASGVYARRVLTLTFQSTSPLADDDSPFDLSLPADSEGDGGFPVELPAEEPVSPDAGSGEPEDSTD